MLFCDPLSDLSRPISNPHARKPDRPYFYWIQEVLAPFEFDSGRARQKPRQLGVGFFAIRRRGFDSAVIVG
jgi:hypothetical protein